jgi:hypothetical protein
LQTHLKVSVLNDKVSTLQSTVIDQYPTSKMFGTTLNRTALMAAHASQWVCSVIVMGLASFFIAKFNAGEHVIYTEVIVSFLDECYSLTLLTGSHQCCRVALWRCSSSHQGIQGTDDAIHLHHVLPVR